MSPLGVGTVVARVSRRLQRAVLLTVTLWVFVGVAAVLLLAWLWAGPEGWPQGTWAPLLLDLLAAFLVTGGVVLTVWARRRWLAERRVARCLEEAAGLRDGTVLSSLELSRSVPPGVSRDLAAFAERGLLQSLDRPEAHLAGPLRASLSKWLGAGLGGLALATPVLVLLAILAPGRAVSAWGGLSSPVALLAPPVLPALVVTPGDGEVLRGQDVEVRVEAPGRDRVTLFWQEAGEVARSESRFLDEGQAAAFELPSVTAPVRYWATAPDGSTSAVFQLTPVDPLFVSDLRVEVGFPPHTGRLPEEYRGDVPSLTLPAGTRIRVDGRASRALGEASLRLEAGDQVHALEVSGPAFSTLWVPRASGLWEWSFRDDSGALAEVAPRPLDVTIVADSAPEVRFLHPAVDTLLPLSLRQPLVLEVRDDYGVANLELVAYRVTATGERLEPVVQSMELAGARAVQVQPVLDVAGWGLLPGDEVRYLARATDNAPAAQSTETREWVLRMPGVAELRRGAQEQLEDAADRVAELARQAEQAAVETRNLQRQAAAERSAGQQGRGSSRADSQGGLGFEQREDVRQALERQDGMAGEVDSLRAELDALAQAMREAGLADPELRSDLNELQSLLDRISTPELRERLTEISRNVDSMDSRQAQDALRRLSEAQEEFRQRLEESLERFRRAAAEQDFRATTSEAEELARLERALAEAMREGGQEELRAEQQAELARQAGALEDHMAELEQRLRQLAEDEAAQGVRQGREQAAEARSAMGQAEQRSRANESRQAAEQADRAAAGMEQAARDLREAQQEMADQRGEAMRESLEAAGDEALALARRQSEIREQMRGASSQEMAGLRGDVGAVLQGVRNMAENVASAMQSAGEGNRDISERAGQAMAALERTISAMEPRPTPGQSAAGAAESAVDALNQLAMSAMEAARRAGEQGGQAGDMMEQLEALAQQQGQLNAETGQIMPMQLGQQALQSQLQDVAQGQESVAGELGRLANEPGSDGTLGDLEALAREAMALAEALAGGRLDAEVRQRQERLFHRLLDAGRTLEKEDEFSEQREGRTAGEVPPTEVAPLSAEALGALLYQLPDAQVLQRLRPAERQLVLEYFERLNREAAGRSRPGGGGGGGESGGTPPGGSR